jgi:hypothetical protein
MSTFERLNQQSLETRNLAVDGRVTPCLADSCPTWDPFAPVRRPLAAAANPSFFPLKQPPLLRPLRSIKSPPRRHRLIVPTDAVPHPRRRERDGRRGFLLLCGPGHHAVAARRGGA